MQKNKNLIIIFLVYFFIYPLVSFDKVGLHCLDKKKKNDILFFFNHGKAFYLEKIVYEKEYIINDENALLMEDDNLGHRFIKNKNYLYWNQNPWNKSFVYKLNLNNLILLQKFVMKKKLFYSLKASLLNESQYYVEVNKYKCKIIKEWVEIENTLINN